MDTYIEGYIVSLRKGGHMDYTTGFIFEQEFVESINNKYFKDLNENLKHFVSFAIPSLELNKPLKCCKLDTQIKPDVCIYQGETRKYVSLKTGMTEHLHNENILTFVEFLKSQNIDSYTIESYLLYQYGDGTIDGTGENRMSSVDIKFYLFERIRKMNDVFNSSKEIIKAFADRVVWKGVDPNSEEAEFLYHGDIDFGMFISKRQLNRHIDRKSWEFMERCVHIGPFVIRPKARFANKKMTNPAERNVVSVSYPRLINDIQYMYKIYNR